MAICAKTIGFKVWRSNDGASKYPPAKPGVGADFEIYGNPLFSPVYSDLLVFDYIDENDNQYAAVIDWKSETIIKQFSDQEYYNPFWTSDGNVMLICDKDNAVYLYIVSGNQATNPVKQFSLPDVSLSHTASPDCMRIAFEMSDHVWTVNMDGTDLKPVTAPNSGYEGYPAWSSDGRHLIIKRAQHGIGLGVIYSVSGDAENIHLNYDNPNKYRKDNRTPPSYVDGMRLSFLYSK